MDLDTKNEEKQAELANKLRALAVDVITPTYNEKPSALDATLCACAGQTYPVNKIFVVDDGSEVAASLPEWARAHPQFQLLRLSQNEGISTARNAAICLSKATFLACVNTEVLPDPDWVAVCVEYLTRHAAVGACYTRTVPHHVDSLLTRWRMRFQEPTFPEHTGPAEFAHGHAVLFRKSAVDAIGGYDMRFRVAHEDADISKRLWQHGWEVHFIARSRCTSIQQDSLKGLAIKQLRDSGWISPAKGSLVALFFHLTRWTIVRAGRNVVKARFHFLPVDGALWACALWLAIWQKLNYVLRQR